MIVTRDHFRIICEGDTQIYLSRTVPIEDDYWVWMLLINPKISVLSENNCLVTVLMFFPVYEKDSIFQVRENRLRSHGV